MMIVLSNYSMSYCMNNEECVISSTGRQVQSSDSTLISFNDLRLVNSKLIELKYEKEINNDLLDIIKNDSIILLNTKQTYEKELNNSKLEIKQQKKEKNIYKGVSIITALLLILSILK